MKNVYLIFSLITILTIQTIIAQKYELRPLADATKYADFQNREESEKAIWIIDKYYDIILSPTDSTVKIRNVNVLKDLDSKTALNPFFPTELLTNESLIGLDSILSPKDKGAQGSSNGGNVSTDVGSLIASSLATLIADRFKEELTIAFLEDFRERLDQEKSLRQLFSKTFVVLQNQDIFNTALWLETFREALDEDLQKLPANIPVLVDAIGGKLGTDFIKTGEFDLIKAAYPNIYGLISDPSDSYNQIKGILKVFSDDKAFFQDKNLKGLFSFVNMVITELGNDAEDDWAAKIRLQKLLENEEVIKTFLGFIIEKHKKKLKDLMIKVDDKEIDLYEFVSSLDEEDLLQLTNYIEKLVESVETVVNDINRLKRTKQDNGTLTPKDFRPISEHLLEAIKIFTEENFISLFVFGDEAKRKINNVSNQISSVVSIAILISNREYPKALVEVLSFLPEVFSQNNLDKSTLFTEFIRYANLGVTFASATTSEELASAINAAVLPVQSYRLKRKSPFSITLNAYAGGFYGIETLNNDNVKNETSDLLGFTAPVGVGFNWALGTTNRNKKFGRAQYINNRFTDSTKYRYLGRHSLSLFISVVDVGALAMYRLSDDQTPVNDIELQNIFAPGAQLIFGIGRTPLSLGVGIQYGPELRKVTAVDGSLEPTVESRGWRYGASLMVDIPLLQIHKKTVRRDKKKRSN